MPTQPPIQWVPGLYKGDIGRYLTLTTHHQLGPSFKKE